MDGIRELLAAVRDAGLLAGQFRALLHVAIGRRIARPDGTVVSAGVTWRALAAELKALRFDTELVREFGADPDELAARDRERFWYSAISQAHVDTAEATAEADKLAAKLKTLGYVVGPAPGTPAPSPPPKAKPAAPKAKDKDDKSKKKKK